jgi:hypothetical protein
LGQLPVVFDALELQTRCGLARPSPIANRNVLPLPRPSMPAPIELYVSLNGSDSNRGTFTSPFRTIEYALGAARLARIGAANRNAAAKIILRAGTYRLANTLIITPQDSFTELTRYADELVVLSGAEHLASLSWQPHASQRNVYVAPLSSTHFSTLFVDGRRAIRARTPNGNPETSGTRHWFARASAWRAPRPTAAAYELHIAAPNRANDTLFPYWETGIGGPVAQFEPPRSYWGVRAPHGGGASTYHVPSGLSTNETALLRSGSLQTSVVSALHCGLWGSWVFAVDDVVYDAQRNLHNISWTRGGFQEARGCREGSSWFIENDISFLDSANVKCHLFIFCALRNIQLNKHPPLPLPFSK